MVTAPGCTMYSRRRVRAVREPHDVAPDVEQLAVEYGLSAHAGLGEVLVVAGFQCEWCGRRAPGRSARERIKVLHRRQAERHEPARHHAEDQHREAVRREQHAHVERRTRSAPCRFGSSKYISLTIAQVVERADQREQHRDHREPDLAGVHAPPAAPRAWRRSRPSGGTPASENIRSSIRNANQGLALVEALEVVELLGLEAGARQQQHHAEGARGSSARRRRRRTSPRCRRPARRAGSRRPRRPAGRAA